MNAVDLLFPRPRSIRTSSGTVHLPRTVSLRGAPVPAWLRQRVARACRAAGVRLAPGAAPTILTSLDCRGFTAIRDQRLRDQAYRLALHADGQATVTGPTAAGLQYGLITLSRLLEAAATGARLPPLAIEDHPTFAVRGFQIDLARDFFPPLRFLKDMLDRAVDLKFNTLWLYLPPCYHQSSIEQLRVQNTFHDWGGGGNRTTPPPTRWHA